MKSSLIILVVLLSVLTQSAPRSLGFFDSLRVTIQNQLINNPGSRLMPFKNVMHDKCIMKQYNQTIWRKKCNVLQIPNTFCTGLCNSFHIPGEHNLKISRSCTASKTVEEIVFLDCPERKKKKKRMVKIIRVVECGCKDCSHSKKDD